MNKFILSFELINSPLLLMSSIVAGLAVVGIVLWAPRRIVRTLLIGAGAGLIMYIVSCILEAMNSFQGPLPAWAAFWACSAAAGAVVGIVGIFRRPWPRRTLGAIAVVTSLVAGFLGVNAAYGVTHNFAAIFGLQTLDAAVLPPTDDEARSDPATLYQHWQPPANMPTKGTKSALTGDTRIPTGQFAARDAALYLPPAALVPNPPALPLLVFMMGQPGSPDIGAVAVALDAFAAKNRGLAPIAIVVDQLSNRDKDPACADSATFGAVATYINELVPQWASTHLNVVQDRHYWAIGGFSNGGACAAYYGAKYPKVWGQMLDVSGNEFPGSEHVKATVKEVYGGDTAAFDAAKPAAIMAAAPRGTYARHTAIFTWGADDKTYGPGQLSNSKAAEAAGFTTLTYLVPGAGHTGQALDAGLAYAIPAIAPTLGLAAPPD